MTADPHDYRRRDDALLDQLEHFVAATRWSIVDAEPDDLAGQMLLLWYRAACEGVERLRFCLQHDVSTLVSPAIARWVTTNAWTVTWIGCSPDTRRDALRALLADEQHRLRQAIENPFRQLTSHRTYRLREFRSRTRSWISPWALKDIAESDEPASLVAELPLVGEAACRAIIRDGQVYDVDGLLVSPMTRAAYTVIDWFAHGNQLALDQIGTDPATEYARLSESVEALCVHAAAVALAATTRHTGALIGSDQLGEIANNLERQLPPLLVTAADHHRLVIDRPPRTPRTPRARRGATGAPPSVSFPLGRDVEAVPESAMEDLMELVADHHQLGHRIMEACADSDPGPIPGTGWHLHLLQGAVKSCGYLYCNLAGGDETQTWSPISARVMLEAATRTQWYLGFRSGRPDPTLQESAGGRAAGQIFETVERRTQFLAGLDHLGLAHSLAETFSPWANEWDDSELRSRAVNPPRTGRLIRDVYSEHDAAWLSAGYSVLSQTAKQTPLGALHLIDHAHPTEMPEAEPPRLVALTLDIAATSMSRVMASYVNYWGAFWLDPDDKAEVLDMVARSQLSAFLIHCAAQPVHKLCPLEQKLHEPRLGARLAPVPD